MKSSLLICWVALASASIADTESPFWGRIYLRHGVTPIQYFRDSYGGSIPTNEVKFVSPNNTLGCTEFASEDLELITNSSLVILDRGVCSFEIKSRNVQAAGGAGLLIISDTEEVVRPVAHVDEGEIEIPTVMVRKSGGEQIRIAANREDLYGKLIPISCPESVCGPHIPDDLKYMTSAVRGGIIHNDGQGQTEWEFLASSFGSPFLSRPLTAVIASPQHACSELSGDYTSKIVIIFDNDEKCSYLAKVSNAQLAGASTVLFAQPDTAPLTRPSVVEPWTAYNITIPSGMVSSTTAREILRQSAKIVLKGDSQVADSWDAVALLGSLSSWPTRKNRR